MSPDKIFEDLLDIEGVKGFTLISSDDGSIIKRGGLTPGNMDDIVAFIGSAGEIITKACELEEQDFIRATGRENVMIFNFRGDYLGIILEDESNEVEETIKETLEKSPEMTREMKLFLLKAKQLNLLIEEFVENSDKEMWKGYISKGIKALSKDGKFEGLLELNDLKIEVSEPENLTVEEINKFMKLLLDFIVKKAISEFGKQQARKYVQNVLKKLGNQRNK